MMSKMDRRSFLKVLGTAGAVVFFSAGIQSAFGRKAKAEPRYVPGSGREGALTADQLDKIDAEAFVSSCARCGICAEVCPSSAIRFGSGIYPQLTPETLNKCMGVADCGLCLVNCPTNALRAAFIPTGIKPGAGDHLWIKGPKDSSDRPLSGNSGGG